MESLDAFLPAFVASRVDRAASVAAVAQARAVVDAVPRLDRPMVEVMVPPMALAGGMPGARVRVEQTLPLWGMAGIEREMGERAAAAAEARLSMMDRDMARMGAMLWADLWWMNAAIGLMTTQVDRMRALGRVTEERYRQGTSSRLDVLALEVEVATMVAELRGMEGEKDTMRARLAGLVACPVDELALPPAALPEGYAAAPGETPERAEGAAMLVMAEAEVRMARRSGLPMVGVMGELDTMVPTHDQWMLGVSVEVPIAWRAARAAVEAAQARVVTVRAQTAGELATLEGQRAELEAQVAGETRRLGAIEEALVPASAARTEAARVAYASGAVDMRTLLMAEADDLRVSLERARVWSARYTAAAELAVLGGVR